MNDTSNHLRSAVALYDARRVLGQDVFKAIYTTAPGLAQLLGIGQAEATKMLVAELAERSWRS